MRNLQAIDFCHVVSDLWEKESVQQNPRECSKIDHVGRCFEAHYAHWEICASSQEMDPDVHRIIESEKQRQKRCVNLIASVARNVPGGRAMA